MIGVRTARPLPARGATALGHARLLRALAQEPAGPGRGRDVCRPAAGAVVRYGGPVPVLSVRAGRQAGGAVRTMSPGLLGSGEPVPTGRAPAGNKDLTKPTKPTGRDDTVRPCRRALYSPTEDGTR